MSAGARLRELEGQLRDRLVASECAVSERDAAIDAKDAIIVRLRAEQSAWRAERVRVLTKFSAYHCLIIVEFPLRLWYRAPTLSGSPNVHISTPLTPSPLQMRLEMAALDAQAEARGQSHGAFGASPPG